MRGLPMPIVLTTLLLVALTGLLYAASSDKPATRPAEARGTAASQPASAPATQPTTQPARTQVVIDTSMGKIVVQLDDQRTPATVANFLKYVDDKFYDDLIFHRVMKGFMIQAGGITTQLQPKQPPHPPVVNESRKGPSNKRGTIAMARTNDPHSATSQFFINHKDNPMLDTYGGGYTVFGQVVEGMDIVDKIADVPVRQSHLSEAQPLTNVVIRSIRRK